MVASYIPVQGTSPNGDFPSEKSSFYIEKGIFQENLEAEQNTTGEAEKTISFCGSMANRREKNHQLKSN